MVVCILRKALWLSAPLRKALRSVDDALANCRSSICEFRLHISSSTVFPIPL